MLTTSAPTFQEPATSLERAFDLGLAWEWEYDDIFVQRIERACKEQGVTTCTMNPSNVGEATARYREKKLHFDCYLDRGSDARQEFVPLAKLVQNDGSRVINNYSAMQWAVDKATMHLEFLAAGLHVPYSIILSPYTHKPEIEIAELHKLGRPFIIKPAVGGGGMGVVTDAQTLGDILKARMSHNRQKYLLQQKIEPVMLGTKRAWFRAYWVVGETFLVWWNDQTHHYEYLHRLDEREFHLSPMRDLITKIAGISRLDFFSAEIALAKSGRFLVVDYVNDVCDMRSQSKHIDGLPDQLLDEIVAALIKDVAERKRNRKNLQKKFTE